MSAAETGYYSTGGTLGPDCLSYVERQADADLYEGLRRGEFCYVLTSRQMGKSSLMVRTAARLRQEGIAVAVLDLTGLGQHLSVEQWYDGLLRHAGHHLDLEDELEEFWFDHPRLSPLQRWIAALQEVVLARCTGRVVIFVDEIDVVQSLPFSSDEFFAAIRQCYNRRAEDPEFNRLTFCLLGVATPSDLIQDTRMTPFNIGRRIELNDFTEAEAAPLRIGLVVGEAESSGRSEPDARRLLARVLYWTGGHPYLTQRLCRAVAQDTRVVTPADVDRLCHELFLSSSARGQEDNLLFVRERLLRSEADRVSLLELYGQVRRGRRVPVDDRSPLVDILRLSGITRRVELRSVSLFRDPIIRPSAVLRVHNRIYEQVFDQQWIDAHMPDADRRRQQIAYRSGLLRAAAVGGVTLAVMGGLLLNSIHETRRADQNALMATRQLALDQTKEGVQQLEAGNGLGLLGLVEARRTAESIPDLKEAIATVWAGWHQAYAGRLISAVGHDRPVLDLAFSPDGTRLATASEDKTVRLWDTRTWQLAAPPLQHDDAARIVRFSPDGKLIATAAGKRARLWNAATGKPIGWALEHADWVTSVAFAPGGKLLASGCRDGSVRLWEKETGQPRSQSLRPDGSPVAGRLEEVLVGFGPRPASLPVAITGGSISLWNPATGELSRQLARRTHPSPISTAPAFGRDGAVRAIASDRAVWLWDPVERRFRSDLIDDPETVGCLALSPDGTLLATAGADVPSVQLWETSTGKRSLSPLMHPAPVDAVVFGPPGSRLLVTRSRGVLRFWDTPARKPLPDPPPTPRGVTALALSLDGRTLATAAANGTVHLWAVAAQSSCQQLPVMLPTGPQGIASVEDDPVFATHSTGGLRLWSAATGQLLSRPAGVPGQPTGVFSKDGKFLARWGGRSVTVWQTRTGRPLGRPLQLPQSVAYVALSGHGSVLATMSLSGKVQLWDPLSKQPRGGLLPHSTSRGILEFSPAESMLATAEGDEIYLWETATGRLHVPPIRLTGMPRWVAFSPDGRLLATANQGGDVVTLWNTASGRRCLRALKHPAPVERGAFSPDGKLLATITNEYTLRLWDPANGRLSGKPMPHPNMVLAVQFSPDGKRLATASLSGARLWDVTTCQLVTRPLLPQEPVWGAQFGLNGSVLALSAGQPEGEAYLWRLPAPPASAAAMERLTAIALGVAPDSGGSAEVVPWRKWRDLRAEDGRAERHGP